jgi:pilus assembly protein CpaE
MSRTRITIVSSDRTHLAEITKIVKGEPRVGEVREIHGAEPEIEALTDAPDLLIVNGSLGGGGGFGALERLGHRHPHTAFIVVSDNQTPEFLLRAMRAGVREVLPDPVSSEQLHAAIGRVTTRGAAQARKGTVVAFISCKGGSGSTFLATNLGYVLAATRERKVALLDLNLQFGNATLYMTDQRPEASVGEIAQQIHRLDASLLSASMVPVLPNYGILAAPDDPAQAVDVAPQHVKTLIELARLDYDVVIVDLGRHVDAVCLQALDMSDIIFPVLQVNLPFIREGKRLLSVLRSLDYPQSKIKVIVNRNEKGGDITLSDLEKTIGMPVCATVPNSYRAVTQSVNQGLPIAKLAPRDGVTRGLEAISQIVTPETEQAHTGWFARILGRA